MFRFISVGHQSLFSSVRLQCHQPLFSSVRRQCHGRVYIPCTLRTIPQSSSHLHHRNPPLSPNNLKPRKKRKRNFSQLSSPSDRTSRVRQKQCPGGTTVPIAPKHLPHRLPLPPARPTARNEPATLRSLLLASANATSARVTRPTDRAIDSGCRSRQIWLQDPPDLPTSRLAEEAWILSLRARAMGLAMAAKGCRGCSEFSGKWNVFVAAGAFAYRLQDENVSGLVGLAWSLSNNK